jgi:hypothetical protein
MPSDERDPLCGFKLKDPFEFSEFYCCSIAVV